MDILEFLKHGISGGLIAIIWYLIHQNGKKKQGDLPQYKSKFLEELGAVLHEHTASMQRIEHRLEKYDPIILPVDPETNYPNIWSNNRQAKRTHETVSAINETLSELVNMTAEIDEKVSHHA